MARANAPTLAEVVSTSFALIAAPQLSLVDIAVSTPP
jgi:hypothetical protein